MQIAHEFAPELRGKVNDLGTGQAQYSLSTPEVLSGTPEYPGFLCLALLDGKAVLIRTTPPCVGRR